MSGLVSIVTPCYNGERYIARFLDCILMQSYRPLELIIINDGSTDRTSDIILSYQQKLQEQDIQLIYCCQDNKGQASALNVGLQLFTGKYFIWPDSDDLLYPAFISRCVRYLEEHETYGLVLTKSDKLDETDLESPSPANIDRSNAEHLFQNVLYRKSIFNLGFMIRTDVLLKAIPQRTICESRHGQNIQILLPVSYQAKCGFIDESLCARVVRADSHSHSYDIRDPDVLYFRTVGIMDILIQTLRQMPFEVQPYRVYYEAQRDLYKLRMDILKHAVDKPSAKKYLKNTGRIMGRWIIDILKAALRLFKS